MLDTVYLTLTVFILLRRQQSMLHFQFFKNSSTPRRTCCEVRVMLCMTQYICAPLQSAGGFILEGDWTPTKTKLLQLTTYRGGSLISFQDKTPG